MKSRRLALSTGLVAVGLLWLQSGSDAIANTPIRVGIYQNEPKVFLDARGTPSGFWPDLLAPIAAAEQWTLEYVPCQWEQCLQAIERVELDLMVDVAYSPARAQRFDFTQQPAFSSWSVIYARRGVRLTSILDLDQKRVAVLKDSIQYEEIIQQTRNFDIAPDFMEVADFNTLFRLLDEGKVDAGIVNHLFGERFEAQHNVIKTNILVAPQPIHLIGPQGKSRDLLNTLDQHLVALKADPDSAYYQAVQRWLTPLPPAKDFRLKHFIIDLLLFLAGSGVVSIILWNQRLRQEIQHRQRAEARLKTLTDNIPGVIFRYQRHPDGSDALVYISSGTSDLWGIDAETAMHDLDLLKRLVHPNDLPPLRAALQTSAAELTPFTVEWRAKPLSGEEKWLQTVARPQPQADGSLIWDGLTLDISWLKQAKAALQKSEEQLRLALDVTNIAMWDWQILEDQVKWNGNHFRLLGYTPGEVNASYQMWRNRVHPDDLERVEQAVAEALTNHTEFAEEYRVIYPDGTLHWMMGRGRGLRDEQGQVNRMLGVMLDITDRKKTEDELRHSEAVNQQLLQAIPDLLIWMTAEGTCFSVAGTSNVANLLPPSEAVGTNIYDLLPPHLAAARKQAIADTLRTGEVQVYEQQLTIAGTVQYEEVRVVRIEADQVLVIVRDISDRKEAELALIDSEERYRLVTDNMSDLVCLHQPNGRLLYITPSCETVLGYAPDELLGHDPYSLVHPEDTSQTRKFRYQALRHAPASPITYRIRHKSGQYIWLETLAQPIVDESGRITHIQTTSRDVSDRIQMEQQLRHDALHDTLTGLPNRSLLIERLELALKRFKRNPDFQFAVLFLDCDHFKVINDSLGHLVGDQLLITIAQKLSGFIRNTDLVARIGGDEFVILLEEIHDLEEAVQVAQRILEDLTSPLLLDNREVFISASIGIVTQSPKYHQPEELVRDADIAMYRAKANGRANYAIFDPAMHLQVLQRLHLENDLRRALEHGEFVLYYQPIVSLTTLKIIGFEALVRWHHPTLGLVTPSQFMTIAEETGLIVPIGGWVLQAACQQLAQWQTQQPASSPLKMSVNLSVKQLQSAILMPQLEHALHQTDIEAHTLTLEITESMLIQNIATVCDLLSQIQAKGVRISIDDFGTGYSSLSYLHQLPVDTLKIDRAFVSLTEPTAKNQTIARSIVALSNLLGLDAIAEGIETPEQLQWLQTLQCEYGQGYLFSPPISAEAAERLLQQKSWPTDLQSSIYL